ncbi:MAG: hypothetical protein Kow0058_03600 [Roseovarius sp.]
MRIDRLTGPEADGFRDGFLGLMGACFSEDAAARRAEAWDWLFRAPLIVQEQEIIILVARGADAQPIGALMLVPAMMQLGESAWAGHQVSAIMVRAGQRGRAGLSLVRMMFQSSPRLLGTPVDARGEHTYARYSRTTGTRQTLHFRPLRPGRVALRRMRLGPLAAVPARLLDALWGAGVRLRRLARRPPRRLRLAPVDSFGPEFDRLWEDARHGYPLILRRDAAYLNWRYRDFPMGGYRCLAARAGDRLVGYVVTRLSERDGRREMQVSDIFCARGARATFRALLHGAEGLALEAGAETLSLELSRGAWPAALLRGAGYLFRRPGKGLMLHSDVEAEQVLLERIVEQAYFTRGDSDQDY